MGPCRRPAGRLPGIDGGVYLLEDRRVFITKMNIGLMSKMYFGVIGEVMREVARTEKALLREIRRRVKQQSAFSASAAA